MDLRDVFVDKLKIESKVTAIDSIFGNEDRVKKTIYNPPYQRNYVWDAEKATYFIESLLIGTEIPPLIFFRKVGSLEIIDGRQRYETILRFMRGTLKLKKSGLKKLAEIGIANHSLKELPEYMRNEFLDTKIRIIEFSLPSGAKDMEGAVKQEIFKRYNSGITPLKPTEIDKAIYLDDDLNSFFKKKLQQDNFRCEFLNLFKFEKWNDEILLKKIRQLLVLHKIPIKYYSVAKQKILDKYYDLLVSSISETDFERLYQDFVDKLCVIGHIKEKIDTEEYNRLYSECLFWGLSVLEENKKGTIQKFGDLDYVSIAGVLKENRNSFKTERSSFARNLVERYNVIACHFSQIYGVNFGNYIKNNEAFRNENKEEEKSKPVTNFEQLRINKPEPYTNTIEDICRMMERKRFLIRPAYQREEVINKNKSSEIIESLLLGIKLPPIFIYKRKDGISEVIDGQQRLLSILAFIGKGYMDEDGQMVKSKKDDFALSLKNSILSDFDKKRFGDLDEESKDKILNFDLWIVEIQENQNPDFETIDLFIRLNSKPFPIKDDTFEMWNSYIDRDIINTEKRACENNKNWFYLRKKSSRMENENLFTVLSFFEYQQLLSQVNKDFVPNGIDIYSTQSKTNIRLRSKSVISKVLESTEEKERFMEAIQQFEFGFLQKLRFLLVGDEKVADAVLSKELEDLMLIENGKRTQQAFYALWYFLHSTPYERIMENRQDLKKDIKILFKIMPTSLSVDAFINEVKKNNDKYKSSTNNYMKARLSEILRIIEISSTECSDEFDFWLNSDSRICLRPQVVNEKGHVANKGFYGIKVVRPYISIAYIRCFMQSILFFSEMHMEKNVVTISKLKDFVIPIPSLSQQRVFDNLQNYLDTDDKECYSFFIRVSDCLVEEMYFPFLFKKQNVSLFDCVSKLPNLEDCTYQKEIRIREVYSEVSKGGAKLASLLKVTSGITYNYYNRYEKD